MGPVPTLSASLVLRKVGGSAPALYSSLEGNRSMFVGTLGCTCRPVAKKGWLQDQHAQWSFLCVMN